VPYKSVNMKIIVLCIIAILILSQIQAQQNDTIFFNKIYKPVGGDDAFRIPLYKFLKDTIFYRDKPYKIKIPNGIDTSELVFGFNYFTGWENMPIPKVPVFLISGFKDFKSKIYVDYNQNLDFSDDGVPLLLNGLNDSITIKLPNQTNHKALFNINIKYAQYKDIEEHDRVEKFYKNHKNGKGNELINSRFWLSGKRFDCLLTNVKLNGDSILIGIRDYTCNGFYNDKRDRIMIGNYSTGFISDLLSKGGYIYEDTTVIKIKDRFYEVVDIEKTGNYIVLKPTKLRSNKLEIDDIIPNFQVKLLDGSEKPLHELLVLGKYNLIDIWGTWCAGCLLQTKDLIRLDSIYTSNLNIIALNYGDSKEKVITYLSEHKIKWLNGFTSKEIYDTFLVDSMPFLLLLKNNQVILIQTRINEVEEIISKK